MQYNITVILRKVKRGKYMNCVAMIGRLTADPEVKWTQDGRAIAKFSLAVNRRYKKEGTADADFFNCVVFGKTAEFMEKYFRKGMKAVITGELRNNHYTDNNGVKHYSEQIVVNSVEFAEKKSSMEFVEDKNEDTPAPASADDFFNVPDVTADELPFA
jgi:single-strand DNA-binding protein